MNKISRNVERDADNTKKLIDMGWKVVTVWECELKKEKREETLKELELKIKSTTSELV